MVKSGVANDHESWFEVLLGVLIGKSTWDPLSTAVVRAGVGSELKDSSLSVWAAGHDLN